MFRASLVAKLAEAGGYVGALPTSYSRMQTLLRCPLLFHLKYARKIKIDIPEAPALILGKKAHMLMEHALRNVKARGVHTVEGSGFLPLHAYVTERSPEWQASDLRQLKEPMLAVLDRLLRLTALPGTDIRTEREIRLDTQAKPVTRNRPYSARRPDIGFLGYVDLELRREGQLNLVDYKTESPSEERRKEVIKQTGLYSCMEFMLDDSLQKINTYCIYLKDGTVEKTASYNCDNELRSLEGAVLNMFDKYLNALRNFKPEARRNKYCEYCEYRGTSYCQM